MGNWMCNQSMEILNIIMTAVAMVAVAKITRKAATDVYNRSKEEKRLEYQAHIHMILKEIGDRLDVLREVNAEIKSFEKEIFKDVRLPSKKGFRLAHHFYSVLRKIKPDGGFDHFREFEILFAMNNLNNQLCYRAGGEKIKNLEKLEDEIEKIKEKMDEINLLLQKIYKKMQDPYSFFKPINSDHKEIVGQVYAKIINGTDINDLNEEMSQISFESDSEFNRLCSEFDEKFSECEQYISISEILPDAVKEKYFNVQGSKR